MKSLVEAYSKHRQVSTLHKLENLIQFLKRENFIENNEREKRKSYFRRKGKSSRKTVPTKELAELTLDDNMKEDSFKNSEQEQVYKDSPEKIQLEKKKKFKISFR